MPTVDLPTYTGFVDQRFVVEPLGGPRQPKYYTDRFPDEVYHKTPESHLIRFLTALLGPAGIGALRRQTFEARILLEAAHIELFDLDSFYGNPFAFGRIFEEIYEEDPSGVLDKETWELIRAKDTSYRNRAIQFVSGARAGNTPLGMKLVAQSGLGHAAEVIENYKYLFDSHSDQPVGFRYYGKTFDTNEMIILPRREVSRNEVQKVSVLTDPQFAPNLIGSRPNKLQVGTSSLDINHFPFTYFNATPPTKVLYYYLDDFANLGVPVESGVEYTARVVATNNSSTVNPPELSIDFVDGSWNVISEPATQEEANGRWEISAVCPPGATYAFVYWGWGGAVPAQPTDTINFTLEEVSLRRTLTTGNWVLNFRGQPTVALSPIASALDVQEALEGLSSIGEGNVEVTGGPAGLNPFIVTFRGALSGGDMPKLTGEALFDANLSEILVETQSSGRESVDETVNISARSQHHLQEALDRIKPVTVLPTLNEGKGLQSRQNWANAFASSEQTEVIRFVTGSSKVIWPPTDSIKWIEVDKEKEAPRLAGDLRHNYQGFQNIANITTDSNLHVGRFSPWQTQRFPYLKHTDDVLAFYADRALADYFEPLVTTTTNYASGNTTQMINGIYPLEYSNLPGVPAIKYRDEQFWASSEQISGTNYLELDLGSTKPVNFLAFEVGRKPLNIKISYDIVNLGEDDKSFKPVQSEFGTDYPNMITPDSQFQSPWEYVEYNFETHNGQIPFTRYLRIEFERRPFDAMAINGVPQPWSIDVRNLRVGRNVSNS